MTRPDEGIEPLLARVVSGYRRAGATGKSILLAVSGGADSLALLISSVRVSADVGLRLAVATVDHGLRAESAREVEGVKAVAASLKVPFFSQAIALEAGSALEARARSARYLALEAMRVQAGCELIATAHTATDQAETLLMRLGRGTALRGASSIHPVRGRVIRPLLEMERGELEAALRAQGLPFVSDPMNVDLKYLRVRVRRSLLPALDGALGPASVRNLASFARLASEDDALLASMADAAYARLNLGDARLDAAGTRALVPPLRRRVLARLVEEAGVPVDLALIARAVEALERGGRCGLRGPWSLRSEGGVLRVARETTAFTSGQPVELPDDGRWVEDGLSGMRVRLCRSVPPGVPLFAQVGSVGERLVLRHWVRADRIDGHKLQDLFVNRRLPREDRKRVPLVCTTEGEVRWAIGLKASTTSPPGSQPLYASAEASSRAKRVD